jgi:hypothetical protein
MDYDDLSEWEREALQRAERRFPLSQPDTEHEFSSLPQLGLRRIRGTYFSTHDNRASDARTVPERYRSSLILIHSEKNRFRFLCDLIMTVWLPEFPEFVGLLSDLEPIARTDDGAPGALPDEVSEETLWQAESYGIAVHSDCYRIGYLSGPAPLFASKDLLLGILELVAEGLTTVGENLEFSPGAVLSLIRSLQTRVAVPPENGDAASEPAPQGDE